jgi:hypothetical protein
MNSDQNRLDKAYLTQRVREMGNPPLSDWGRMAHVHWESELPEMARELKAQGLWHLMAVVAQEDAKERYSQLIDEGLDPMGAKEIALKEFILLDPTIEKLDEATQAEGESTQVSAFLKWLNSTETTNQPPSPAPTTSSPTPPRSMPAY